MFIPEDAPFVVLLIFKEFIMALGFTALALGINKFVLVKLKLLVHVDYYERETIGGDIVPAPQDDEYK